MRLILNCQAPGIVDGTFGIVSILALHGEKAVFQTCIIATKRLRQPSDTRPFASGEPSAQPEKPASTMTTTSRAISTKLAAVTCAVKPSVPIARHGQERTNHSFRLLSGTTARRPARPELQLASVIRAKRRSKRRTVGPS